jgi:NTE family protein
VSHERFEGELQLLRDNGSRVDVIIPDEESSAAFGMNLMDASRRQPSAQAGLRQGHIGAARIIETWH